MPFIDNNTSSLLFKTKRNHVIKSTLICSAALAGIMAANPLATTTVKADAAPQIETSTTNWVATKPVDIHVDNNQKTYTLNRGDTLWAIAQATNTDVNQLAQLNNINLDAGDQYHLAVGLTIKLTADAQTDDNGNNNSSDNTNTATQNSAVSDSGDNTQSTTANNSSTAQTASSVETSSQNNSANTAASGQTENGSSNADDTNNATSASDNSSSTTPASSSNSATTASSQAGNENSNADNTSNTGSDTTKNGQIDTSKSQVSKPADVVHNESGTTTSGKTNSQPTVSQSGILNDGSISSQTPSSSTGSTPNNNNSDTASSKANTSSSIPATGSSQQSVASSSTGNTPNDNTSNTSSSKATTSSSAPASSSSKANSNSATNASPGPVNNDQNANSSSSNANSRSNSSNNSSKASSSNNNTSSNSSSSSKANDNNSQDTRSTSNYKQTAPLNDNDLAKVVALEKQLNDLQTQTNTVSNNLQFYQSFIDATKNANGTNPQDRLDEIAYQNTYYQKTVDGYSDMSDEQAKLTAIKAQLPVDAQTITNLQNQLAKPNITDAEKQTLTTDLNNAKATAIKDQETYQTLQAKINQASELVTEYKAFLARNADMTAALKGNGQNNSLVTQYQKYINDNQNTQNSLNAQIADVKNQLKAYGVTLNS